MSVSTEILGIGHCSYVIADTARSVRFYREIVGLQQDHSRPQLGFPGAWFQIGAQSLHLLEVDNVDPVSSRPDHGGRDRHLAIHVSAIAPMIKRLQQHHIAYSMSRSGRPALFFRDPDGNTLEIIEAAL